MTGQHHAQALGVVDDAYADVRIDSEFSPAGVAPSIQFSGAFGQISACGRPERRSGSLRRVHEQVLR